ncbi:peptidoglycan recognition protein family protein [Streptomyces hirsutus]|uniref:peptidoglycan recognition protein family protein n=1 Tax=Streptomyces hirsutus TaxID=35620 RepID=UPI0036982AC3
MRVLGRPRGGRRRHASRISRGTGRTGLPRTVKVLLGCLPGVAAAVALVLCAYGVERAAEPSAAAPARRTDAYTAPRPPIVSRAAWARGTDRKQPPPRYDDKVIAVFVHHTDSPNDYDCAEAPTHIRSLYEGQTTARDWDDIGYNFVVDRCGTIYEGRAGGTDRPVTGAHTQGFNHRSTGIAALGTFTAGVPVPPAMERAIAELAAWKLGLSGTDPRSDVRLVSSNGGSRYAAGTTAMLPALAGHSDGFMTSCPGAALQARLPRIRGRAAELQGRWPDAGGRQEKQREAQEKAQEKEQEENSRIAGVSR